MVFYSIFISKEPNKYVCVQLLSQVLLFATLWTVVCQAPLSKGFPRQEYWSGLPFPTPGALPDPGIELMSLASPSLTSRFFTTLPPGKCRIFTDVLGCSGVFDSL